MSLEFHRVLFVLLFVMFGSLSALGFDQMTKSQQRVQQEITRAEQQLQQLPKERQFNSRRFGLLCQLAHAYQKVNRIDTSKMLHARANAVYVSMKPRHKPRKPCL